MDFEPALFDSTMFETANEAFLFCKDHLEKKEHYAAAARLEGFAPINTALMGQLALSALTAIQPTVKDDAREWVHIAINSLKRALNTAPSRVLAAVA